MVAKNKDDERLAAKRQELRILDGAIAERRQYRDDQETAIDSLVTLGNNHLKSLEWDITLASQELKEIRAEIRERKLEKQDIEREIGGMNTELAFS